MEDNKDISVNETTVKAPKLSREMIFLAEQAADSGLKVLPGEKWALHYPVDEATRQEKLQGLLDGKYGAEEVKTDIKPDAVLYDVRDIERQGLKIVSGRIRDISSFVTYYDYSQFAKFVESMRGKNIPLGEIDSLYSEITKTRTQKKVMDAYGYTGRRQMEEALVNEANDIVENIGNLSRSEKVLKALKINWLSEDLAIVPMEQRDQVVAELSGDERSLFEKLESSYRQYVQGGDEGGYEKIKSTVRDSFEEIQKNLEENQEMSESMQELDEELSQFEDKSDLPGSPNDSAIPPEDSDEYHTPPPPEVGESGENSQERAIFEIEPPLGGYYISGRKSYYDIGEKTWSKKKQINPYQSGVKGEKVATISGLTIGGDKVESIPIPNGYALDATSLRASGQVEVFRDQNGCFYIKSKDKGKFSVDFKKEDPVFIGQPVTEDTSPIYKGSLSTKTESVISRLNGTSIQKAEQARQYLLSTHFYPGGGDLNKAGALQYKLRMESTPDNYVQNLDKSEYLECYSANTLFVAILRKAGVPARLVVGHRVEGSIDGKSAITQSTGHAWTEIWDGKQWRRFDATPSPKPEDQKKDDKKDDKSKKKEGADEADDGGIESPHGQKQSEENQQGNAKKNNSGQSGESLDEMENMTDGEMQQSQQQLEQAKKQVEKVEQKTKELNQKIQEAKSFEELSKLKEKLDKDEEIFEELKEEIEKKVENKEKQMKDSIKDELDKMVEDGFMSEEEKDNILKELEEKEKQELDQLRKKIEEENSIYATYEQIREEIRPLVNKWFEYFASRLPKQDEIETDESSLTRQGSFDRRSVMKARNLLFGTVKNPREIRPSIKPKFMASILLDVSGSMSGQKLESSQKLLIFYSELFSRISDEFGYIRFSINTFSDSVTEIKNFEQNYDSAERYLFSDGTESTVKVRLMKNVNVQGGTNMFDAIRKAADELNRQAREYPDYASSFYFIGDGGDTRGNEENIKRFLQMNNSEHGFGEHMYSAILLGNESQRNELANIFGDEHTEVVPDLNQLIEESMIKFEDDLRQYLENKNLT